MLGRKLLAGFSLLAASFAFVSGANAGDVPADRQNPRLQDVPERVAEISRATTRARRKANKRKTPLNAAMAHGLYTVEKQGEGILYRKGFILGVGVNVIEADL